MNTPTQPQPLPLETDVASVRQLLDDAHDFLLLDCRESDEYAFVHLQGSTLIPMSELRQRVSELEPHRDRHVVVYCHHGGRSLQVTQWLRRQGFPHVQNMAGGIDAWSLQIDPSLPRY